jgi:hypothetical protein
MRHAIFLAAALSSLAAAAPQSPEPSTEIGVIFVYTDGTQSEQLWVPDSISQVPLSTYQPAISAVHKDYFLTLI